MRVPLAIAIVLRVLATPAVAGTYAEEQPSLISSLLDLLPEVEAIAAKNSVQVDVPRIRRSQIKNIKEIFEMFIPFMKEVIYNRAQQTGEEVSEETYETIETLEKLFPKLLNLVVALSTRPQFNPDDEPALPDYRSIAKGRRRYKSSEEDGEGNFVQLPKVDKEVLRKVLNQTTTIFSQISKASISGERSQENSDRDRDSSFSPYYIGSSSTTRRPYTPRRRTYTTPRTTTQRPTYGTTKLPRTYADTPAASDDSRSQESFGFATNTELDAGRADKFTSGAQVPFFTLPTTRSRSYQRVTRGSSNIGLQPHRQLKQRNYFYL